MDTNDISSSHRSRLSKEQRRRTVAYGYGLMKSTSPKEDRSQVMPGIEPGHRSTSRPADPYRPEGPQRSSTFGLAQGQMLPRRKREELLHERRETFQPSTYPPPLEQSISPPVPAMPIKQSTTRAEERRTHSSSSYTVLTKLLAVADRNEALMRSLLARMDAMDTRMQALALRMDEA
ncbi:uncharacterized protein MYCFIDRAFT_212645 [Pseudocercospora fijiensis CIRAD86]|uniref:Uncharacterized protein n=1 Tax=Pseudocercospora fijiensis (strain CIRAD86) TaxID=383855 RepID=M3AL01_PSEFD|nr:uncharacterized protein MYCFIDRAFT_212645 [Pseudocercospora fijiensis CIRAD86]EME78137.1 hypothetical protein MYCFIDRAFT_212645 [Pseudocercospora fijiensis CIRAD86]